jgi:hypothetical protein
LDISSSNFRVAELGTGYGSAIFVILDKTSQSLETPTNWLNNEHLAKVGVSKLSFFVKVVELGRAMSN